jgi:DNA-3-methyladenine glycosylase I
MGDSGIVRNRRKILATIHNAKVFEHISQEHGSFQRWLDHLDKSENYTEVIKRLIEQFNHVGKSTAQIFFYSVGEQIKHD